MKKIKEKDLTQGLAAVVRSKGRIDILKRIFALKFKTIIPPSGSSVKALCEFYEENYEVFVAMEKWKRRLCVLILAACATVLIFCAIAVADMFFKV